jgi:hypothetical protein
MRPANRVRNRSLGTQQGNASVTTESDNLAAWNQIQRGLEFGGEQSANWLRLWAIGLFYAIHVLTWHGVTIGVEILPAGGDPTSPFHTRVTLIVLAWMMLSLGLLLAMRNRIFPPWLKYLTTGLDLLFLSSVLLIADGPRSASVGGLFVIVALSALRFDPGLIRCAAVGAMVAFGLLVAYARATPARDIDVSNAWALMMPAALLLEGMILSRMVGRLRQTAAVYAERIRRAEKSES